MHAPEPGAPAVGDVREIPGRKGLQSSKANAPRSASSSAVGLVAKTIGASPSEKRSKVSVPVVATPCTNPRVAAPVPAKANSPVTASGLVPKAAAPSVEKAPSPVAASGLVPKAAAPSVENAAAPVAAKASPSGTPLSEEQRKQIAANRAKAIAKKRSVVPQTNENIDITPKPKNQKQRMSIDPADVD